MKLTILKLLFLEPNDVRVLFLFFFTTLVFLTVCACPDKIKSSEIMYVYIMWAGSERWQTSHVRVPLKVGLIYEGVPVLSFASKPHQANCLVWLGERFGAQGKRQQPTFTSKQSNFYHISYQLRLFFRRSLSWGQLYNRANLLQQATRKSGNFWWSQHLHKMHVVKLLNWTQVFLTFMALTIVTAQYRTNRTGREKSCDQLR